MKKLKIGILGFGEVGQAIAKFYKKPQIKDLKRTGNFKNLDVLHICIPWSKGFCNFVRKEIKNSNAWLVIIHSTVAPGTTRYLNTLFKGIVVHSPVRGVHPFLYVGIKTFTKYVGGEDKLTVKQAVRHLKSIGIKAENFGSSISTEIAKLLDTTYYGLCIAWAGEMEKICNRYGADVHKIIYKYNRSYNTGYKKLRKSNVIRPILFPPEGGIGGHCVIPNAKILKSKFKSKAIDLVLQYE